MIYTVTESPLSENEKDEKIKELENELRQSNQKNQIAMMGLIEVNNRVRALEGK